MRDHTSSFSLHRICAPLIILGLIAGMFILLASGFVNTRRPSKQVDELQTIYEAIVGDRNGNTFGYLGDVGDYPKTLSDLISPSPVPPGWNGPYIRTARNADNIVYPNAARNPGALDYESLGQVSFNIEDFDENAPKNGFVAGCPGLYDIVISSVPRRTDEAYITYNPGTSVVDLLQGQYLVTTNTVERIATVVNAVTLSSRVMPRIVFSPLSFPA